MDLGDLDAAARLNGPFITAVAVLLIVWFSIMALTGWLAGRRNREGGLWAAFALFFGPVALLTLLLMSRPDEKPAMSPLWAQLEEKESAKPGDSTDPAASVADGGRPT
ncbi:MAG TPA: hypothetical protein VFP56_11860 [Candidatus Limnocylindrales bacterium]|nr:hypothetical protein [Candidatus Limnocylindrales bacterium]